jgi:superfamily II DNA or RNA helicase
MILRKYQDGAVLAIRVAYINGRRSLLLVVPTGGGKTIIAVRIIEGVLAKGKRVLFLAHRKELIEQTSAKLDLAGIDHGIIMAGNKRHRPTLPVQVASIQTIQRRLKTLSMEFDLVIVDEAHHSLAKTYLDVLDRFLGNVAAPRGLYALLDVHERASAKELRTAYRKRAKKTHPDMCPGDPAAHERFIALTDAYEILAHQEKRAKHDAALPARPFERAPNKFLLGLTATPYRLDRRPLGRVYEEIIVGATVRQLVDLQFLVPPRAFVRRSPNLTGVHMLAGDYDPKELGKAVCRIELVKDTVDAWFELAWSRLTLVFGVNLDHCEMYVDEWRSRGVPTAMISGKTPAWLRAFILSEFAAGNIRVLVNCEIAIEGLDIPPISCVVLGRPTCSKSFWKQMCGRALRPYPGKNDCIIQDHSGLTERFGLLDEEETFSLLVDEPEVAYRARICPFCGYTGKDLVKETTACPQCKKELPEEQFRHQRAGKGKGGKELEEVAADGDMVEWKNTRAKKNESPAEGYTRIARIARERGRSPGWLAAKFREQFNRWPRRSDRGKDAHLWTDLVQDTDGAWHRVWSVDEEPEALQRRLLNYESF